MPLKGVMNRIIEGLMGARMTEDWRHALQQKPIEVWTEQICSLISPHIEHLLTAPSPPSLTDWSHLNGKTQIKWVSMGGDSDRHSGRLVLATISMLVQPLALVRV